MKSQNRTSVSEPSPLRDILQVFIGQLPQQKALNKLNLQDMWQAVMGKPIAQQTQKIFLKNNILYVKIASSALRQELEMHKTKILALLNEKLQNQLTEIHFN